MKYEKTQVKATDNSKVILHDMHGLSTSKILWFVVRRHKVGLLATWATVVTLLYIFPPLPDILLSLI